MLSCECHESSLNVKTVSTLDTARNSGATVTFVRDRILFLSFSVFTDGDTLQLNFQFNQNKIKIVEIFVNIVFFIFSR